MTAQRLHSMFGDQLQSARVRALIRVTHQVHLSLQCGAQWLYSTYAPKSKQGC